MYSLLVDDSSEHEKAKGLNKYVVATIKDNEYKNVLLNSKCLRYLMNRIQSENDKVKSTKFLCLALIIKCIS